MREARWVKSNIIDEHIRMTKVHHIKDGQVFKTEQKLQYSPYGDYWYDLPVNDTVVEHITPTETTKQSN